MAGLGVVASAAASQPVDTRSQGGETSKPVTLLSSSQCAEPAVPEARAEASAQAPRRVTRLPDVPPVKVSLGVLKTHDETWSGSTTDAGYYTVDGNDGTLALQQRVSSFSSVVSAVKVGETVYTIQATADGRFYYQSFNASTWAQRGSREEIDDVNVTQDFAYDSSSNTVYGYFYKESDNNYGYIDFGRYNVSMAEKTSIVEQERDVYTCASDNNGLVYWLSSTQLGWSDPKKKTFSYIYGPQVYPEDHSTMTYDPTSGLLYALVRTEATGRVFKTSLYSIDPVAKSKTLIKDYGKDMGFAGLFVLPPDIALTAPGQATDITVNFDGTDATLGTVSLTVPSQSRSGAPLTSPLTVIIEVDGTEYAVRDVAPGSAVTSPQYRFAEGAQKIVVTCADATDRGEAVSIDVFAGFDIPAAPQGVVLTEADGKPQLLVATRSHGCQRRQRGPRDVHRNAYAGAADRGAGHSRNHFHRHGIHSGRPRHLLHRDGPQQCGDKCPGGFQQTGHRRRVHAPLHREASTPRTTSTSGPCSTPTAAPPGATRPPRNRQFTPTTTTIWRGMTGSSRRPSRYRKVRNASSRTPSASVRRTMPERLLRASRQSADRRRHDARTGRASRASSTRRRRAQTRWYSVLKKTVRSISASAETSDPVEIYAPA